MKKGLTLIFLLALTIIPCQGKVTFDKNINQLQNKMVFIYHIPDEEKASETSETLETVETGESKSHTQKIKKEEEIEVTAPSTTEKEIRSDDITADTSGRIEEEFEEEEDNFPIENYQINDLYTDVLQGYAEYNEEEESAITLDNPDERISKIQIQKPLSFKREDYTYLNKPTLQTDNNKYSKYKAPEYSIAPLSNTHSKSFGGFSTGTIYNQEVFYGELEQSSGIFSKYQYKNIGLSLSYKKTVNSTNNNYNDNFLFTPEWKLNQYFTLRETLSADITKNRQKAELTLSINPFGKRDIDRLNLEFGVNQTYYLDTAQKRNQIKFSTKFKL